MIPKGDLIKSVLESNVRVDNNDYQQLCIEQAEELAEVKLLLSAAKRERDMAMAKLGGNLKAHWVAMETGKNNFRAFKKSTAALCVMVEKFAGTKDFRLIDEMTEQAVHLVDSGAFDPNAGFLGNDRMAAISPSDTVKDVDYLSKLREGIDERLEIMQDAKIVALNDLDRKAEADEINKRELKKRITDGKDTK